MTAMIKIHSISLLICKHFLSFPKHVSELQVSQNMEKYTSMLLLTAKLDRLGANNLASITELELPGLSNFMSSFSAQAQNSPLPQIFKQIL